MWILIIFVKRFFSFSHIYTHSLYIYIKAYFKLLPIRWSIPLIVIAVLGTWLVQKIRKRKKNRQRLKTCFFPHESH